MANEYEGVSKLIDDLSERIKKSVASNETELTVDQNPEASVQSELTTSRLKEHERLTANFISKHEGCGDLNNVNEDKHIQPKSPLLRSSAQDARSESSSVRKIQIKENYSRNDDDVASSRKGFTSVNSAHFKRAMAELEKRRCLERHEIERQQQVLEQKLELLRVKQEMDVKQANLRQN